MTAPVALVTGGARRIGAAIVTLLAAQGYSVAIHRNRSTGDSDVLAADIDRRGGRACVIDGDLADAVAPARILDAASRALGPVTLLVNNAAIFADDDLKSFTAAEFDRHMAINLRAPLLLAQAFCRQVTHGTDPSIVNLVDQRVLKPTPDHLSYFLSKSGLMAATRAMAQALAPHVRVNAVAPGPALPNAEEGEAGFLREIAAVPLQRASTPTDIAEAVLFLARAKTVTGQMIAVDSGQHIGWRTPDVVAVRPE